MCISDTHCRLINLLQEVQVPLLFGVPTSDRNMYVIIDFFLSLIPQIQLYILKLSMSSPTLSFLSTLGPFFPMDHCCYLGTNFLLLVLSLKIRPLHNYFRNLLKIQIYSQYFLFENSHQIPIHYTMKSEFPKQSAYVFDSSTSFSQPPPVTSSRLNFAFPAPLNLHALQFLALLHLLRLFSTTSS